MTEAMQLLRGEAWMDQAACAGHPDPDLWHHISDRSHETRQAQRICAGCPVKAECWVYGTVNRLNGVWGSVWLGHPGARGARSKLPALEPTVTVEEKQQIRARRQAGETADSLARAYGISPSYAAALGRRDTKAPTACRNGHPIADTVRFITGKSACLSCREAADNRRNRKRNARRRERRAAARADQGQTANVAPSQPNTACRNGHDRTETVRLAGGESMCVPCRHARDARRRHNRCRAAEVDPVAVERCAGGQLPARLLTAAERVAVVKHLAALRLNDRQIANRTGLTPRTILRLRRNNGVPAARIAYRDLSQRSARRAAPDLRRCQRKAAS